MTLLNKSLLMVAALALSACSNPDRFGNNSTVDLNNPGNTGVVEVASNTPGYFTSTIGDRVLFEVDQSTLSPEGRQTALAQSNWLLENSSYAVLIEGHADEQGTREYNLALSAKRASAVQQFMISQGVGASRIRTVPYGKERPLEICSEESCYAKNRRAVTVLQAGTS